MSFAGNLHAAEAAPATPTAGVIAACTVTVPTGDYALVTLDFSVKGAPKRYETWTYMGGIRGGRSAQWTGVATINDLSGLRMTWRGEEIDIGQGPGSMRRLKADSNHDRVLGYEHIDTSERTESEHP